MAVGSSIEWTDATWNPVAGCTPVSAGCKNCYAARMALRLSHIPNSTGKKYRGTAVRTRGGLPVFTGKITLDRNSLDLPRSWRFPRLIFVNSMSDIFHVNVPFAYVKEIFAIMKSCPQHTFQVLTKRPERALAWADRLPWPENVWLGTSVEDARVLDRVDALRDIPASVRFLSCQEAVDRAIAGPFIARHQLGNSWRRIRSRGPPDERALGHCDQGKVSGSRRAVLLQAMGRYKQETDGAASRRPNLGRDAVACG